MGQFSSITSLKAESIYNSGFALVRYISQTYGEDKLKEISNNLSDLTNFSIDKAFRQCLGIDGTDLYSFNPCDGTDMLMCLVLGNEGRAI